MVCLLAVAAVMGGEDFIELILKIVLPVNAPPPQVVP